VQSEEPSELLYLTLTADGWPFRGGDDGNLARPWVISAGTASCRWLSGGLAEREAQRCDHYCQRA
jgi:hypothetical protein